MEKGLFWKVRKEEVGLRSGNIRGFDGEEFTQAEGAVKIIQFYCLFSVFVGYQQKGTGVQSSEL